MKALLATKLGMTQLFDENGRVNSVTLLQAGPCTVTQVKEFATDGYDAIQVGFGESKHIAKPQEGHLKKSKAKSKHIAEFRITTLDSDQTEENSAFNIGDIIKADVFSVGDMVEVSGISKGKGFAGTIKRHNFARGPKTHGSHNYREPGSIGAGYPQHVFKGQKMAGRMGTDKVTVKNLKIVLVDADKNIIAIKGAIPGPNKGLVRVQGIVK
ncbi:MAG: 50S ribosomal protein L3 [Candidatus Saccharibacteria bacterium]